MKNFRIIYTDFFNESERLEFYTKAIDYNDAFNEWYDYFNRGRSYHCRLVEIQQV